MIVADREYVMGKYKLHKLKDIEELVAQAVEVNIPFNNPITGFCAFTHKAGIHAKAILNNPSTYEIINPADFGAGLVLVLMRQRPGTANTPVFLTSFAATVTRLFSTLEQAFVFKPCSVAIAFNRAPFVIALAAPAFMDFIGGNMV